MSHLDITSSSISRDNQTRTLSQSQSIVANTSPRHTSPSATVQPLQSPFQGTVTSTRHTSQSATFQPLQSPFPDTNASPRHTSPSATFQPLQSPFQGTVGLKLCIEIGGIVNSMSFDSYCGRDVIVSGRTATRRGTTDSTSGSKHQYGQHQRCYVFGDRPLQCGGVEELSVVILGVDPCSLQGLTFGMTSCAPSDLRSMDNDTHDLLPADPDELMDRSEYWVVVNNLLSGTSNSDEGDVLTFQLMPSGEVRLNRNGVKIQTLMFIDKTLPMWPFVNISGRVKEITISDSLTASKGHDTSSSDAAHINNECNVNPSSTIQTTQRLQRESSSGKNSTPHERLVDDWETSLVEEFKYLESKKRTMSLPSATEPDVGNQASPPSRQNVPPLKIDDDVTSPSQHVNINQRIATRPASFTFRSSHRNSNAYITRQTVTRAASMWEYSQQQVPQSQQSQDRTISDPCSSSSSNNNRAMYRTMVKHEPLVESSSEDLPSVLSRTSFVNIKSASVNDSPFNISPFNDNDNPIAGVTNADLQSPIRPQKRQAPLAPLGHLADKSPNCGIVAVAERNRLDSDALTSQSAKLYDKVRVKGIEGDVDNISECCMCYERPRDCVIYRCGHICICYECALEIREFHVPALCPICRQPIGDIIKIYKS